MDPERWQQIEALLDAALEIPAAERSAFLERRCAGDPDLRQRVERILAAGEQPTPLPASPVSLMAPLLASAPDSPTFERPRIGAYQVLRQLGVGGMGTVFLAERADDQYHKRVAIKVLRHGLGSDELVRRFRHERQILAQLEHAHIARLLDGGVVDGAPFIVMEYVEGEPLDVYCDRRGLGVADRLLLFADVCAAVQYAHQNLIVHRDLKPSNILVTGDGQVKLVDFGIAKLLDDDADTPLTRTGMHAMTPEYAAPEQVRGGAITTATDVYALGVVLYQLLAGQRPYELGGRSFSEIERAVCETEPVRPSTAVGRRLSPAAEGGRAADRLQRVLRGDLDTLVMKALQKDPQRRYPSAAALLDDLIRYRRGRPLRARPDTLGYRGRKFVQRHRSAVAAAVVLLLLLQGFAVRETQLRRRAQTEAQRANAVRDYLTGVFEVSDPFGNVVERADEVSARALLDRGVERLDVELAGQPRAQAEMLGVLGNVYANLGLVDQAESLLQRSLVQRRALFGNRHAATAEALHSLAGIYLQRGQVQAADSVAREALALRRALFGNVHEATAHSLDRLATVLQERSAFAEAAPLFREALDIRVRLLGRNHTDVAASSSNLALLLTIMGDYDAAEPLYRQGLEIRRRILGQDHAMTSAIAQNLAQLLHMKGQYEEAERLYRESLAVKRGILGDAHPSVTVHLSNLGALLRDMGRMEDAEAHIREALALDRQIFGDEHTYVAANLLQLASTLRDRGRFDDAEATYRQALAMNRRLLGDEHTRVLQSYEGIGLTQQRRGDGAAAERTLTEARAMAHRLLGEEHPRSVALEINLARVRSTPDGLARAELALRSLIDRFSDAPNVRVQIAAAHVVLGQVLASAGRLDEALPVLEQGLELSRAVHGDADWRTAEARSALGRLLAARQDFAAAEPLLVASYETLRAAPVRLPLLIEQDRAALVTLYTAWQKPESASRFASQPLYNAP